MRWNGNLGDVKEANALWCCDTYAAGIRQLKIRQSLALSEDPLLLRGSPLTCEWKQSLELFRYDRGRHDVWQKA